MPCRRLATTTALPYRRGVEAPLYGRDLLSLVTLKASAALCSTAFDLIPSRSGGDMSDPRLPGGNSLSTRSDTGRSEESLSELDYCFYNR